MFKKISQLFGTKSPKEEAPSLQEEAPSPPAAEALGQDHLFDYLTGFASDGKAGFIDNPFMFAAYDLTNKAPLADAIAVVNAEDHWLLVTLGISDLYAKSKAESEMSGLGYELCLRLQKEFPEEEGPKKWALDVLFSLSSSVNQGKDFFPRDSINTGPIDGTRNPWTGFVVFEDPVLASTVGPFGEVAFHLLVGVTEAERALAETGDNTKMIDAVRPRSPSLVTES